MTAELHGVRSAKRTKIMLVVSLVVLLGMLVALVVFYLTLVGPSTPTIVTTPGIEIEFLDEYYGIGNAAEDQFRRPRDVAVRPGGGILVADSGNGRIVELTSGGALVRQFGTGEWGPGDLAHPSGIEVGPDGRVYVADKGGSGPHGKLAMLSSDLTTITDEIVFPPDDPPIAVRVIDDELYVTSRSRILVYTLEGELLREWGTFGKSEGSLAYPSGIARLSNGTLVVSDTLNKRIQFFDKRGTLESVVGTGHVGIEPIASRFGLATGVAVDEHDRIFVSDAWHFEVAVIDVDGEDLAAIGSGPGTEPGQLDHPAGIYYVGDGFFFLADELNDRIVRFKVTFP